MTKTRAIAVNNRGLRVGEDHQHARYTNREVELVLELRDSGLSYRQIACQMEMPRSTVASICTGRRRNQLPAGFKTVVVSD